MELQERFCATPLVTRYLIVSAPSAFRAARARGPLPSHVQSLVCPTCEDNERGSGEGRGRCVTRCGAVGRKGKMGVGCRNQSVAR